MPGPLFHDIRNTTPTLLLSGSAAQVEWGGYPVIGITGNELADTATKLAAEGSPPRRLQILLVVPLPALTDP